MRDWPRAWSTPLPRSAARSAGRCSRHCPRRAATASALTSGYHLAFWVAAGLVIAAIGVAAVVIQPEEKAAEQFAEDGAPGEIAQAEETAYPEAA